MLQKLKIKLFSLVAVLTLAFPLVAAPATVLAANSANIQSGVCEGASNLQISANPTASCNSGNESTDKVNNLLTQIINIFSVIVGVVAVIMIIVGGFRYVTSGGQAEKITGAKNTILYALIGLVIVALSQIVVKFVLTKTTQG